ncbi:MAG: hypothetical protein JWQ95_1928 [Sphaerisporangium sp.]|nr:hypothetical protein [Sphaerisporangium sp.]
MARDVDVGSVTASDRGVAVGVNYGTVQQLFFHGQFTRLRDATVALDPLPGDLRLRNPADPADALGMFTGRGWLLTRIDTFIGRCVARGRGAYLLVEAEAGMGKSALAAFLAFTRGWPTHATRLGVVSPEGTRTNLAAQLIARWGLTAMAPDGVLPAEHDTTKFLYNCLCEAARRRDETEPGVPVVLVVDGLDEAPPPEPGQMPFGLPTSLPAGTVVVATSRPGVAIPRRLGVEVARIDVESQSNRTDLLEHLDRVTVGDPAVAGALADAGIDRERFRQTLVDRSAGVWIYAVSVLDQIRDQDRSPAEVDRLPDGLAGYYADNIARWQAQLGDRWDTAGLPMLMTVGAVRDAQPAAVLAGWAGVPVPVARTLLGGPFKPFLAVRPGGDPDVYTIRHQSLRDLCEGRLSAETRDDGLRGLAYELAAASRAAHDRITTALTPAGSLHDRVWPRADRYLRAHLAEHAAACRRLDELAEDPEFLLLAGVPTLLRLRRRLTTRTGLTAVAALELASNSWGGEHDDQLRWLCVSAHKLRATGLAHSVRARLPLPWCPSAAAWSGTSHRVLSGHTNWVTGLVMVPRVDGTYLLASAGDDRTVRLWDPESVGPVATLTGHTGGVSALVLVPRTDGTYLLASAGEDRTIRLWDPESVAPVATLTGHTGGVSALAIVPRADGTHLLASAGIDRSVRLWDPESASLVATLTGHTGRVNVLTAVPRTDGTHLLASAGADRTVRLWDPGSPGPVATLTGHTDGINALAVVPRVDDTYLLASAGADRTVRLWDLESARPVATLTGHTSRVNALAVVPRVDGTHLLASAGIDRSVRLWDPESIDLVATLTGHTDGLNALAVVPRVDGTHLLASASSDRTVRLWDPESVDLVATLTGHTGKVRALAVVPRVDGAHLLASAGDDRTVRLWDPESTGPAATLTGHTSRVNALAAVPRVDGTHLLASAGIDRSIRLWDPESAGLVATLTGHTGVINALAIVPTTDGTYLLASAGEDRTVRLWDPESTGPAATLTGHTGGISALVLVPRTDGTPLVASASSDRTVRLWDPETAGSVATLTGHTGGVSALAVVPRIDGTHVLVSAGDDGAIIEWRPSGEDTGTRVIVGGSTRPVP